MTSRRSFLMKAQTSIEVSMTKEKDQLLDITLSRLDEKYPYGLYEYLYMNDIRSYSKIFKLDDSINMNFNKNGTIQDLKAILREYWIEHIKAIKEFKKADQTNISLDEVRVKRIEALETEHVV